MKDKIIILLATYCLLIGHTANAQTAVQTDTLRGAQQDGNSFFGDLFGEHVAVDNEWLIVGAPREDVDLDDSGDFTGPGEFDAGAIYIYRRSNIGPVLHTKIVGEGNNTGFIGDRFGAGVTLAGDWLFVGAANDNHFPGIDPLNQDYFFAGKVYVYQYDAGSDSWDLTQKLTSDAPNSNGSFGARTDSSHVELFSFRKNPNAKIALIGEIQQTDLAAKLHVFREESGVWTRIQIVGSPSGAVTTSFADSVTRIGDFALVPESGFDLISDPAMVHVYRVTKNGIAKFKGKLQPVQSLASPSGNTDFAFCSTFGFGAGLGAGGDTVAIAEPCNDVAEQASGVVHVYRLGDTAPLSFVQTLANPVPQFGAFFGGVFPFDGKQSISVSSDVIAVGSPQIFGPVIAPQDVYLFGRQNDGTFLQTDNLSTPEPGVVNPGFDGYGLSVTLGVDDDLYIGQAGAFGEGGGRLFMYKVDLQ